MRATRQLARFLTRDDESPEPSAVTRPVFLDYLAWTRRPDTQADARLANTVAYLLESLHDTQIVPASGSAVFLRRGENVHRKTRSPRPFPPDVIERVDTLIVDNPATDPYPAVDDRYHPVGRLPHSNWSPCPSTACTA